MPLPCPSHTVWGTSNICLCYNHLWRCLPFLLGQSCLTFLTLQLSAWHKGCFPKWNAGGEGLGSWEKGHGSVADESLLKHPLLPLQPPIKMLSRNLSSALMGPYVHKNSFTQAVVSGALATLRGSAQIRSPVLSLARGQWRFFPFLATPLHIPRLQPQASHFWVPSLSLLWLVLEPCTFCPLRLKGSACFMTELYSPLTAQLRQRLLAAVSDLTTWHRAPSQGCPLWLVCILQIKKLDPSRCTMKSEFPGERLVGLFSSNTSLRWFFLDTLGKQQLWTDILIHNSNLKFENFTNLKFEFLNGRA